MATMTKEECAKQYVQWLYEEKSDKGVQRVVAHINTLTYSKSKEPISYEYKKSIVEEMEKIVPHHDTLLEYSDNQSILELIGLVKDAIGDKK